MNKINVKIKKVCSYANVPIYGTEFSAGFDLRACIENDIVIKPHEIKKIETGIALEIPTGFVGLVFARSGLASKFNIAPVNKVGVVDSDYRGEILVFLYNASDNEYTVKNGDRIAQMSIIPYYTANFIEVDELENSERGTGGFGSTGIK